MIRTMMVAHLPRLLWSHPIKVVMADPTGFEPSIRNVISTIYKQLDKKTISDKVGAIKK
ncbi:MAG: hypothetical protein UX37_C0023G0005 [Microgenomates group bacterium GW2011_GWA2_46_16]|nr:MAG: hypothetical protein UX37_C0023G0005 [Microgenomates group bacterium GW2011_GWA2_46_16]